jgi:hypothetical protein
VGCSNQPTDAPCALGADTLQPTMPGRQKTSLRRFGRTLAAVAGLAAFAALGCNTDPPGTPVFDEEQLKLPPKRQVMRVTKSFGGTHRQSVIDGGVWFQSFENRLILMDAQSGSELIDIELAPRGTTGVVSDFALTPDLAYAVLENDLVLELDLSVVREPKPVRRWGRPELGILPRAVSVIDGQVFVSGEGGVVRLAEAAPEGTSFDEKGLPVPPVQPARLLDGRTAGRVVPAKGGPIACVGRRIVRLEDGAYLGAASALIPLPKEAGGGFGFILQASEGAQIGLMDEDFRERSSSALRGKVHSIRFFDDRFFAINDFEVATWKLVPRVGSEAGAAEIVFGDPISVPVKGARDIAKVQRNRFAISGTFGRALYRYLPEGDRPGDAFYWTKRLPGRLEVAASDRRRILAASIEGTWLYLIGEDAELVDAPIASPDRPLALVETSWGSARVETDLASVTLRMGDRSQSHIPSLGGRVNGLVAADGRVWVAHDHGIDVIGYDPVRREAVAECRVRLDGPIVSMYPNRVGGGVSFASGFSGFGVVNPVAEDAPWVPARGVRAVYPLEVVAEPTEEK